MPIQLSRGKFADQMRFFLFLLICCGIYGCTTPPTKTTPKRLPEVHLDLRGVFFLPECQGYFDISPKRILVLPTVQEALLSGFQPDDGCSKELVDARLAKERDIVGEIVRTPEMEQRQGQLLLRRQLRRIEQQQDEIKNEQDEMKRKLEDSGINDK